MKGILETYPASTAALEALPAKYWPTLRWLKRHRRLDTACRAISGRLCARKTSCRRPGTILQTYAGPIELARPATLRGVLELLLKEKELFPSGEDKFTATICAD